MRFLPFIKPKGGCQFAGGGLDTSGGGGGYTLPVASANTLGGIKVGNGLSITGNGVLSTSGGGGSSVNISQNETITGRKYNNKDTYIVDIPVNATTVGGYVSANHDFSNVENIISISGGYKSDVKYYTFGYPLQIVIYPGRVEVVNLTNNDVTNVSNMHVVVEYTKNS